MLTGSHALPPPFKAPLRAHNADPRHLLLPTPQHYACGSAAPPHLQEDVVRVAQQVAVLAADGAEDADGEAGAGEGVPEEDVPRQAQLGTEDAHLPPHGRTRNGRFSQPAPPRPTQGARTSSLKSSRSGSMSLRRMVASSPPTLWCDLIVAEGPLNEMLSMTSG